MELSNGWHEAIVSGTIAAAWVFSLIGGFLSGTKTYANCSFTPTRLLRNLAFLIDRLGRKPVILAASVVFAVGSVVMGAADGKEALLVGRIVVGIGIGMWAVKCFSPFQQWTKAQQSIDPPTACVCVSRSNARRCPSSDEAAHHFTSLVDAFFSSPNVSGDQSEYHRNEENEIGGFRNGMKFRPS